MSPLRICLGALSALALLAGGLPTAGESRTFPPACHGRAATVVGTPGGDTFTTQDVHDDDVFVLRGGRDWLETDKRNVTVCGGPAFDEIYLDRGITGTRNLVDGGRGADLVEPENIGQAVAPTGTVLLFGGKGRDELGGGNGNDTLKGGPGGDFLFGGLGHDLMRGGRGSDNLHGDGGNDLLYGGKDDDALHGAGRPHALHDRDLANGGPGRDLCRAEIKRNCER